MRCFVKPLVLAVLVLPLFGAPSSASRAAADACAAGLPANGKLVYTATIPAVAPGVILKDVVRSKTRALVIDGKLQRADAEAAAEAAGACLKQAL